MISITQAIPLNTVSSEGKRIPIIPTLPGLSDMEETARLVSAR